MKKLLAFMALCIFAFGACALAVKDPTPAEQAAADYGPLLEDAKDQAMEHLKMTLFDPMSAVVEFKGDIVKGWWKYSPDPSNPLFTPSIHFGWKLTAIVNAKNRMGAFVGFKTYTFCFEKGKLLHIFEQ